MTFHLRCLEMYVFSFANLDLANNIKMRPLTEYFLKLILMVPYPCVSTLAGIFLVLDLGIK